MTIRVPLPCGRSFLIDDFDEKYVRHFSWCTISDRYVGRRSGSQIIYLHRALLNVGDDIEVDHRDGDGFNNQRDNLRVATRSQQLANARTRSDNTSGFRGVHFDKRRGLFAAEIKVGPKRYRLGRFRDPIEAACAYNAAALKHFGEFARVNRMD